MRVARRIAGLVLGLIVGLGLLVGLVPLPDRLGRAGSTVITDARGGWLRVRLTGDDGGMIRVPVRRDEIPRHLVDALLAFEDQRFYAHFGVDPIAIARAAKSNLSAGRVVSGGSTITMQIARMLERRPRTLAAKLVEVFRAIQLETRYTKDELIELYFNLAPYGGNVEGIGAAAYVYFGKRAAELGIDEVAILAAIPNSPAALDPRRGPEAVRARRDDVLDRMVEEGVIEAAVAAGAKSLPVTAARRPLPFLAPHYTEALAARHPGEARIDGTIDPELQRLAERLLDAHLDRLERHGIAQGAVLILETESRKIRAYVGSRRFFDPAADGQVDGVRALRSPGSTLKPFVYVLGLERGLIGAKTLLEDVPLRFKDWAPENFDKRWRGMVPADAALAASLNLPAVRLAKALEPEGLVDFLGRSGFSAGDHPERYGLAAVLGGVDVSLLELTNAYATLGAGGTHRAPSWREGEPAADGARSYSPEAAHLVLEILADVRRPEFPETWRDSVSAPRIAFKTGTSYGHRDAWSVGVTPRYALGVWIGNFDGIPVPELVGASAAAPLLLELAAELPGRAGEAWFEVPAGLVEREVCALSGAVPHDGCPYRQRELALAAAPVKPCALHQRFEIDDERGVRLCARCRGGRPRHVETHVVWPASVAGYVAGAGQVEVPAHNPDCAHGLSGEGPVIRAPQDGDTFVLRPGVPLALQQIALIGSVPSGVGKVFWFVDDVLVDAVEAGRVVTIEPRAGAHRIVAVDAEGRRAEVGIRVLGFEGT